jgi:Mrp family chromosome partitioning ATPase/capsular polysaccharide biosynthesis protein
MAEQGNDETARQYGRLEPSGDQTVGLRRSVDALRRNRLLILAIVTAMTGTVLVVSLLLPESYRATARIVKQDSISPVAATDVESVRRQLATIQMLVTTRDVLDSAARSLPGHSVDSLEENVSSSVDRDANIINISATDGDAQGAAAMANAVARSFLAKQQRAELEQVAAARASLLEELERLGDDADAQVQVQALQEQLSQLNLREASAGSQLELAQRAEPPSEPSSPRPVRNTILAVFASAFLAVLVALGRDQLVPRVSGPRELSRLTDLPVIASLPYARPFARRLGIVSEAADESYRTLATAMRMNLPGERQHTVLLTSALPGEGKTEVSAALGRTLAQAGERTLLVSGDLRWPTLHEAFGVSPAPGLAEILTALQSDGRKSAQKMIRDLTTRPLVARTSKEGSGREARDGALDSTQPEGGRGELHLLASGRKPADPAELFSSDALGTFFEELDRCEYSYVVVDGPPLLGLVDGQLLAELVGSVLVVCRLDRLTLENVVDLRELLSRLEVNVLGLVVIGARNSIPDYLGSTRSSEQVRAS